MPRLKMVRLEAGQSATVSDGSHAESLQLRTHGSQGAQLRFRLIVNLILLEIRGRSPQSSRRES